VVGSVSHARECMLESEGPLRVWRGAMVIEEGEQSKEPLCKVLKVLQFLSCLKYSF
jgi:hypothetical protein